MADLRIVLARCREGIVGRDERIQQLEEALRKIRKLAESFERYHLDMARKPDPWMHQIRNITDAAISPSEAPEKEGEGD